MDEGSDNILHVFRSIAVAAVGGAHAIQVLGAGLMQNIHARVTQSGQHDDPE